MYTKYKQEFFDKHSGYGCKKIESKADGVRSCTPQRTFSGQRQPIAFGSWDAFAYDLLANQPAFGLLLGQVSKKKPRPFHKTEQCGSLSVRNR